MYPCFPTSSSRPIPASLGGSIDHRTPASTLNRCLAASFRSGRSATGVTIVRFTVAGCSSPPYEIERTISGWEGGGGMKGFL